MLIIFSRVVLDFLVKRLNMYITDAPTIVPLVNTARYDELVISPIFIQSIKFKLTKIKKYFLRSWPIHVDLTSQHRYSGYLLGNPIYNLKILYKPSVPNTNQETKTSKFTGFVLNFVQTITIYVLLYCISADYRSNKCLWLTNYI